MSACIACASPLRRLRSLLPLFAACLSRKTGKRWRTQLRRLTLALGEARDTDVQVTCVQHVLDHEANAEERPGVERLLLRLQQRRQAQQEPVITALERFVSSQLSVEMEQTLTHVAEASQWSAGTLPGRGKFARAYTGRPAVIGFEGGFHGRTLLSLTLTSKTHPYKAGLGPFAPEVYRVPFAQDYRGPDAGSALAALERALLTQVAAENVAAIVIEPVQGEGGFVVAPRHFMEGVRRICDEHGIVLVVDEVQTGFARTGRMWAIEHYGVEPDLMTIAKSIAAGLPLSGVIGRAAIMDAPGDSAIGGTYVGNPVAQAAALAVLDVIEEEGLIGRSAELGETIRSRMLAWHERFEAVGDVRGLGSMLAIELVTSRETKEPAPDLASAVVAAAAERGLLLLKSGIYGNCIRVLVPLVISDAELDEALGAWEDALAAVLSRGNHAPANAEAAAAPS